MAVRQSSGGTFRDPSQRQRLHGEPKEIKRQSPSLSPSHAGARFTQDKRNATSSREPGDGKAEWPMTKPSRSTRPPPPLLGPGVTGKQPATAAVRRHPNLWHRQGLPLEPFPNCRCCRRDITFVTALRWQRESGSSLKRLRGYTSTSPGSGSGSELAGAGDASQGTADKRDPMTKASEKCGAASHRLARK